MILSFDEFEAFTPQKPTYALFGWPLGHTISPELHAALFASDQFCAEYIGVAVPPEKLSAALTLAQQKLCGINLTIPHKQAVLPFLSELDSTAQGLHSVNTITFTDGKAKGFNTDILGFSASLARDNIVVSAKKVLLLGYGGAAAVMGHYCARAGAALTITGRNTEKAEMLAQQLRSAMPQCSVTVCNHRQIPREIQIVINGTPLGMFPQENACPLRFLPRKTEYVFDAIYNPPTTSTMRLARGRKVKTRDGLYMLVMQAAYAQTIWTGRQFSDAICSGILKQLYGAMAVKRLHDKHKKQNLVLCGFMGSGKTTAGRKLARVTGLRFIDADRYLEEQEGLKIPEIFERFGEEHFRDLETKYLAQLSQERGIVLALGGGAVLRPQNVEILKTTGLLVHLDTPFFRIVKNLTYSANRPLLQQGDKMSQTRKLYNARKNIYHSAADISVRSPRLTELIDRIIKSI